MRDVTQWLPCLGGAPANVTVGVARLGGKSALLGVTGDDEFGHFLRQRLSTEGVDTSFLRHTHQGKTGLGFVSLTKTGERSFIFYRTRAAETFLGLKDTTAAAKALAKAKIVHVGTNSLLETKARTAVIAAVARAHRNGRITSLDPNLRLHLWPDQTVLRRLLTKLMRSSVVVKLSEEEIEFVTGTKDVAEALARIERLGVVLAIVTRGGKGATVRFRGHLREVKAPKVRVIDTTGAGDGFSAGLLAEIARHANSRGALEHLNVDDIEAFAHFACRVGAHVVTQLGAVAGLPTRATMGRHA